MTRVRAIWTELVERRLWPIAALLVVALVAVPLILSSGGNKAAAPTTPAQSAAPANAVPAAVVSVDASATAAKRNRKGGVRDPFVQQHVPAPTSATSASGAGPSASPLGGPSPPPQTPTTSQTPATVHVPGTSSQYVYHAVVRVKQLGKVRWLHDVARFDYLPSSTQRYVMFLGVLSDRHTALFSMMVPGHLFGNARCRPSRRFCATFELKAGGSELLTIPHADGTNSRVRLTLRRIVVKSTKKASSAAKAASARRATQAVSGAFVK
jgi:hypothetical protein